MMELQTVNCCATEECQTSFLYGVLSTHWRNVKTQNWLLIYGNNLTIDSCLLDFVQNGISIIEQIHANPWMQTFLDWMIG